MFGDLNRVLVFVSEVYRASVVERSVPYITEYILGCCRIGIGKSVLRYSVSVGVLLINLKVSPPKNIKIFKYVDQQVV